MKKNLIAMIAAVTVCASLSIPVISTEMPTAYATAIERLYDKKIINGFEDGSLHPELNLTRAQFAKILCKAFPDVAHTEKLCLFSDLDKSHWAYDYIQKAVNAGWLEGFEDQTFRPEKNITYEQAVTILCRILDIRDYGSYPDDYIASAIDYSITDGVSAMIGDVIDREQAAQLIENAFTFSDMQYSDDTYGGYNLGFLYKGATGGYQTKASSESFYEVEAVEEDGINYMGGAVEGFMPYNYSFYDTEEYNSEEENVFKDVFTSPLSTFSIDTDTASYSNLRRFILNGQEIKNGVVRSEELINYFDYTPAETEEGKPFGVKYTVSECPWNNEHELAMITVSGEELQEPKPSNIVFLIDISGSMYDYNKLPLVKHSLSLLLDKLNDSDTVSIVTYASGTEVRLEPTLVSEKDKIMNVINSLSAGGGTYGSAGITLAYEQAEKAKIDGNNRIILCTDGDFNIGISSDSELENFITQKRNNGIFLSVLGFGMGNYKDSKMELLADKGNGNYAYIDNLREAKKVLVDDMPKTIYTIAKDVKIQVEFNPAKVSKYRLIGYENRILNNEDFENDKKDAGELGAGATVTVLYEIIPSDGTEVSPLEYQTPIINESDNLMTVKIRYKLPDKDESILAEYPVLSEISETPDEDFCFAAAVAELGMLLNSSEYSGDSSYDSVISLAKKGVGNDTFGLRNEFIQLVDLLRYKENLSEK